MISHHSYQSPINERHVCKINYPLTHLSIVSRLVIFYWHVSHLLDFDIADIVSFDTKCLLPNMTWNFTNYNSITSPICNWVSSVEDCGLLLKTKNPIDLEDGVDTHEQESNILPSIVFCRGLGGCGYICGLCGSTFCTTYGVVVVVEVLIECLRLAQPCLLNLTFII